MCLYDLTHWKAPLFWVNTFGTLYWKYFFNLVDLWMQNYIVVLAFLAWSFELSLFPFCELMHCIFFSHINRRTQFENPVLEAKRRLEQQRQMQSQGLSALPLPTIYRGTHAILEYVQNLNQNMLTDPQSCTNMEMQGLQKRRHMALIFRPSRAPWNPCALI